MVVAPPTSDRFFTPLEVAEALRISRRSVYDRIASGDLDAIRVGSGACARLRIPATSLSRFVRPCATR